MRQVTYWNEAPSEYSTLPSALSGIEQEQYRPKNRSLWYST